MKLYVQKGLVAIAAGFIIVGCMLIFWLAVVGSMKAW